ncbi:hypothetical protein [Chengkuizengella sediminis]|uniref:hypothetical protein n=1 Tax=Chengkuizengella sediminis TaxID=1885917 RepID=UPI001389B030|nr:hypothetical protein [Chengkuizengella sediminis]NDI36442.1 hypothetical protein [Chengkuizengella sediminis]
MRNVQVSRFSINVCEIPMIVISQNPKNHPLKYVARLYDRDEPSPFVYMKDSLSEVRDAVPKQLNRLESQKDDHPTVIETWS